jgi:predicted transposase YbfD/YdcC
MVLIHILISKECVMQSTASARLPATPRVECTLPFTSIYAAFAHVPDPRRRQGTRYPLAALLTLAVAALLANHRSLLAIAEWGAAQTEEMKRTLGFPTPRTPHVVTLQRVFRRLDPSSLERALTTFFDPRQPGVVRPRGSQGIAIDGKAQRGRLPHETTRTHPVHAVSALCHDLGLVLTQIAVNTPQHEAELTVIPALICQLDWQGRVLTGDALYCQRTICRQVVEAGGDYVVVVDNNQPTLQDDIEQLFAPPPAPWPGHAPFTMDEQHAYTVEKAHGRLEERTIRVSSELAGYLDWPYLAQVFAVTRTWTQRGQLKQQVRLGITSLPRHVASATEILLLQRGHWHIENRLHYVKDVTLGEDHSAIHCDAGPHVMAALRNTAISLLRRAGHHTIAARLRHNSRHPTDILPVLGLAPL